MPGRDGEDAGGWVIGKRPTAGGPLAMGYVEAGQAAVGTRVLLLLRGKPLPARVAALPFVQHRYARKSAGTGQGS